MTRLLAAMLVARAVSAHQQPTTMMLLDAGADNVEMKLHVPLNELELAFGHDVMRDPERNLGLWRGDFERYLREHIHPTTEGGQPWRVHVRNMTIGKASQTQSGPFQEVFVSLLLEPPAGAGARSFDLHYDLIMHQVVTHKALVAVHSDWAGGMVEPAQAGVIAVNTATTRIEPMPIRLGAGSAWKGFAAMVRLGMAHIREGTDHLLFLLVLLLPATLVVGGGEWGPFQGTDMSLRRVLKIVTAFTLGHSATLLAGALRWLTLPQQPVEVLIAVSILATAIHAIRPVFPGKEAQVAAGFGLVHGLAFASVLTELTLPGGRMAFSILGFNLGIELMQVFVIAMTIPWLVLLSMTPAHRWVRVGGAVLAGIASIAWIASRVSGEANAVEQAMNTATRYSPLGILILALTAVPAYAYHSWKAARGALLNNESLVNTGELVQ